MDKVKVVISESSLLSATDLKHGNELIGLFHAQRLLLIKRTTLIHSMLSLNAKGELCPLSLWKEMEQLEAEWNKNDTRITQLESVLFQ